jgi:DNA sulfur modification protein DndD
VGEGGKECFQPLAKRAGTSEHQAQVASLEQLLREHQATFHSLSTGRASLENDRLRAESEWKEAEEAFAAGGGKHWDAPQDRSRRLGEVVSREEAINGQLSALASGDLPLALVPELLQRVEEQDRRERQVAGAAVMQRLLVERDRKLLDVPREARATPDLLRRAGEHLEADRAGRQATTPLAHRLDLSEPARSLLRHLREQRLTGLRREAAQLLKRLVRASQEREDLKRAVAATPDEADIGAVMERFKTATQQLALLTHRAGELQAAIDAAREKVQECEGNPARRGPLDSAARSDRAEVPHARPAPRARGSAADGPEPYRRRAHPAPDLRG